MFWEMYQQSRISAASAKAGQAQREAMRAAEQTERLNAILESKVESLALTCQAMFEILQSRASITEAELEAKMEEIDLRDGVLDGRITPAKMVCSACGRRASRDRKRCLYCGAPCEPERN